MNESFKDLQAELISCQKCPRLVAWREQVAQEKRKSFQEDAYWGRPVPYFGDPNSSHLILGLAPAAHGANRTGRMFTGDRSGDFLFAALHRAGVANQPLSVSIDDGLELKGVLIAATCHCAPPANKPLPIEIDKCSNYLQRLLTITQCRSVLCLGGIAWNHLHSVCGQKKPIFGHGTVSKIGETTWAFGSYHPSQQNTFTGRLTEAMIDEVIDAWLKV